MRVQIYDEEKEEDCHCPVTGRIGNLDFSVGDVPCLVSSPGLSWAHDRDRNSDPDPEADADLPDPGTPSDEPVPTPHPPKPKPRRSPTARPRKTNYTVEAISLSPLSTPHAGMRWVGVNQTRVNRFVEHFLRNPFPGLGSEGGGGGAGTGLAATLGLAGAGDVQREVSVGDSKVDFCVGGRVWIEIKTPLIHIPDAQSHPAAKPEQAALQTFQRLVKHFKELTKIMKTVKKEQQRVLKLTATTTTVGKGSPKRKRKRTANEVSDESPALDEPTDPAPPPPPPPIRCIFLLVFMYDAPPFRRPSATAGNKEITAAARAAQKAGVEMWQCNMRFDMGGVQVSSVQRLEDDY
ncbi:hypothetical protein M427DRAFT_59085 [Gonapodya prolifera JEL478]|uniref:Uncharacterized protein n=1 Tax=Gonapodya prolifera (strain JEL478) TaxID=1344416 RepID=A0A139A8E5_GONPJ|nr:hypothetical protein M427DRAFT_59085 [Gonapodya prolifera JEL478]|eukprot:KXS12974.1 hypothetical protein M427DRAFT_59085 [Gonapodya prolifera JEL478]